ncbi:phosphoribosylanthranilate isomerase [Eubacterium sp.]
MAKIKICGLRRQEDIEIVNRYKPDYIGFVFAKSKRQVNDLEASELKSGLSPDIKAVGVFVNDDINHIEELVKNSVIDIVQFHGDEDEEYIKKLKGKISVPVIKAVRVRTYADIKEKAEYPVEYLLLDSYSKDAYGGTGERFDISLIENMEKPYFLAGGVNEDNISDIIKKANPYCIDLSSGVETDGFKDETKIKNVINIVRNNF